MTKSMYKLIAGLEIFGGIAGTAITIYLASAIQLQLVMLIFIVLMASIFLLSIYAGVELWRGSNKGVKLSKILQALQIFQIISPYFIYQFLLGVGFTVEVIGAKLNFSLPLGGQFAFNVPGAEGPIGIGINFVAVWAFYQLQKESSA